MYKLINTTVENIDEANIIAEHLVSKNISKCTQVIPGVISHYNWNGQLKMDKECLLIVKVAQRDLEQAILSIESFHSYDTPEIIVSNFDIVGKKYKEWFDGN